MKKKLLILLALGALILNSGCGHVPQSRSYGKRGLFQNRQSGRFFTSADESEVQGQSVPVYSRKPSSSGFIWPLRQGMISSDYGRRGNKFHDGLDISVKKGTPVYAAKNGVVVYAGSRIQGYGKLIIVQHERNLASVYAHNDTLFVRKGDKIGQGRMIALVGSTGHSTGPHLHFEVRRFEVPENPMKYLLHGQKNQMARK